MNSASRRSPIWFGVGLIALACGAAYANTFAVPLLADDLESIGINPTIRRLWPLSVPLHPPGFGMTVQGRPLLNLSLAVNYAISGTRVWSYHAGNLLIHVLAACTLFGVLRRAGLRLAAGDPADRARDRWVTRGALLVALIWALHPLQTEAVTYLVQRAESLMGLCYLATLYAFLRGVEGPEGSPAGRRPRRLWLTASVTACLLGMMAKEVMVSVPVVVFACDRCLIAGSVREAWRRRWGYYLALAATWVPLVVLAVHAGARGGASGPGPGLTFIQYWLTQPSAIAVYLRLVFWPAGQVFYYGAVWVDSVRSILPDLLLLAGLGGATLYGLARVKRRGPALLGFLGLWFFAVLAPTSLVPGRSQTLAEHRMYLASIPVLIAAAWLIGWCGRLGRGWIDRRHFRSLVASAGLITAGGLALATYRRNDDYATARMLYAHDVAMMPESGVAHANLGTAYLREGRFADAVAQLEIALQLGADADITEPNLGAALEGLGFLREAESHYRAALRLAHGEDYFSPQFDLFRVMVADGRKAEAIRELEDSLRAHPGRAKVTMQLARGWAQTGLVKRALPLYEALVACFPDAPDVRNDFGIALAASGRVAEAVEQYLEAIRLAPAKAEAHYNLAMARLAERHPAEARREFAAALNLRPDFIECRRMLERLASNPLSSR